MEGVVRWGARGSPCGGVLAGGDWEHRWGNDCQEGGWVW